MKFIQTMNKLFNIIFIFFICPALSAQLVEVQANYNSVGDVEFTAYNNFTAPLFLNIDFADLENASFNEPLPYVKMLEPGFNTLFMLQRDLDAGVPRFNYQIKYFRSDPLSPADLNFPYLIPFRRGTKISVFTVKSIQGFWGSREPDSWNATGFNVNPGQPVCAARNGIIVEIAGEMRTDDPQYWYHAWNNSITILQPDGTLICYRNITADGNKDIKVGEKIFAGQQIGSVSSSSKELILLIFQHSLNSKELRFIIPQFVTGEGEQGVLLPSKIYEVVHPEEIRTKEMTKREIRKTKN
jgi:murein DD-endopeptidase MepM/ murein hydrolase activator NlpD